MRRDDLLDLNDTLQHPGRVTAVDVESEFRDEPDVDLVGPLTGFLEAVSTGNALLIEGEFRAKMIVECARCGAPLEKPVEFRMDEQFPVEGTPSSLSAQDYARVKPEEPFPLFEGNALMVEELLRQGLLLAVPDQPLCEFGWEGECPVAAERGAVAREIETARPEFARLNDLLKGRDEEP